MAADSVMLALYHLQCLKDRLNSICHRLWSKCSSFPEVEAGNPAHFQHISREEEHRTTSRTALQTISNQFCFAGQRTKEVERVNCAAVSSTARGRLFSAILRACEPEPRAASREPRAASREPRVSFCEPQNISAQKNKKRAKCPDMVFITCGVLSLCQTDR